MKDIYEILNDIDIDEKEFEEAYVTEKDKAKIKLNLRKSINKNKVTGKKKIAIAASILFLIGSSIILVNPAIAKSLPIIGNLLNRELVSVNKQYADYIDVIGKTKSDKGIDVTFESAIADDNKFFLNFTVKNNNKAIKENPRDLMDALRIPHSLKINGENLIKGGGASWEFIDDKTIKVLAKVDWAEYKKNDKMNIDIGIDELFGNKGNWGINFFIDKSKLVKHTVEYNINKDIKTTEREGSIDTIKVSPLTVFIKGTEDNKSDFGDLLVNFIALDDKGHSLLWNGCRREDNKTLKSQKWSVGFINTENSKSVTLIPLCLTNKKQNKLPPEKLDFNKSNKQLILNIDSDRSIKINDYFIEEDYLVVKSAHQYNGKEYFQNYIDMYMPIYLTADGIEIKESFTDKKSLEISDKYKTNSKYETTNVYKIGKTRNIGIGTYDGSNLIIMKDKTITVKTK